MTKPRRIQSVISAFWLMIGLTTHMAKPNITKPKRLFITSRYSPEVGNHLEADKPIMIKGMPKPRLRDDNAMTPLRISSSLIRENIVKGKSIDDLINPLVKDYLKKHGLYGSKNST